MVLTLVSCSGESDSSAPAPLETSGPEVVADADGTGLEVSQRLFDTAPSLVVTKGDAATAAQVALDKKSPLVEFTGSNGEAIKQEASRLHASLVEVGDIAELDGDVVDPGDKLDAKSIAAAEVTGARPMPVIFASHGTSLPAVTTARAAGADVELLDVADPRITSKSMKAATSGDTLALGKEFGTTEHYAQLVDLAHNGELPGGGGLVFPGRRMIALYGHPSGPALGVMGEQPPKEAVDRAEGYVKQYQEMEEQPVIPAFEIIVSVASNDPGDDGNYTNEFPPEDYEEYIDAITEAGGYAVLDLQPGRSTFLEQAKLYEKLLKRPNVGLALDAEWMIGPDQLPLQEVGHSDAAGINEVTDWLAKLVRDNHLPQKALIVHQFQVHMLPDRENIKTDHPELAFVLHADGHGTPDLKFGTWDVLKKGLSDDWFMAWKNFIDEDNPTFTPEQTYNDVKPRPWFVSYQ